MKILASVEIYLDANRRVNLGHCLRYHFFIDFASVIILLCLRPWVVGNKILPVVVIDNKMNGPFCKGKVINFAFDDSHESCSQYTSFRQASNWVIDTFLLSTTKELTIKSRFVHVLNNSSYLWSFNTSLAVSLWGNADFRKWWRSFILIATCWRTWRDYD